MPKIRNETKNETTSKAIAKIAARAMKDPLSVTLHEIQRMAASCLTQTKDKQKDKPIKKKKKK